MCGGLSGAVADGPFAAGTAGTATAAAGTGDLSLAALLGGLDDPVDVWNATGQTFTRTYAFAPSTPTNGSWSSVTNYTPLDAAKQAVVRQALALYAEIIPVTFVELAPESAGQADIAFGSASLTGSGGWAQYHYTYDTDAYGEVTTKTLKSVVILNKQYSLNSTYGENLVLHEIGHTFTLKHPGNYDSGGATPDGPFLPAEEDNNQYTVMSYNDHPGIGVESESLQLYDIAALQYRFGANLATRSGDTVYSDLMGRNTLTIWDGGGTDTLDFSARSVPLTIDLRAGAFSSIEEADDLAIAYSVTIENVSGGSGSDTIRGNDAGNGLTGGGGDDTLTGGEGDDTLTGGEGEDVAVFEGTLAQYKIGHAGGALTLTGPDGTDTLTGVERLMFGQTLIDVASLSDTQGTSGSAVYRFYNPRTGTHFYTGNATERDALAAGTGGLTFEGTAFQSLGSGHSVWRFFNTQTGAHFYTISDSERDAIQNTLPQFQFEGEAYKASTQAEAGLDPLYRFYNTQTGAHFFTANLGERDAVIATLPQFTYEGVAYYIDLA